MPSIYPYFASIRSYAVAHKTIALIGSAVLLLALYWGYGKIFAAQAPVHYTVGVVTKGTIISAVSGSGQVSTTDSVDVKPRASGDITSVLVQAGQTVHAGQAIAYIDSGDAVQTLNDAKASYQTALLQYQKDSAQAPIDFQNAGANLTDAQTSLQEDYNDTFNHLTSTYLDLPAVMTESQNSLFGYDFDGTRSQWNVDVIFDTFANRDLDVTSLQNFKDAANNDYSAARTAYNASLPTYQQTSRTSSGDVIEALLDKSITTVTDATQSLQSELNYYSTASDMAQTYERKLPSNFAAVQSAIRSNLSTANSDLSTLLADKKTIAVAKQSITNAEQQISLSKVGNPDGSNPISLQISKTNLDKQAQDIAKQESDLADYTIRSPFDGTVTAVNIKRGDTVSTGTAAATIVTKQQIAELSLNEIDVAKVKVGDKATLTFDAIDGLSITGSVAQIDAVGTVSQGVVSYDVKISFDTQDSRVKPGMTVNADIQTDVHQSVLIVPASAIKTTNGSSFVQVFQPAIDQSTISAGGAQGFTTTEAPIQISVELGISDDTNTEVISGLTENEQIITRTTSSATKTTTTSTTQRTGAAGATRIGGFGGGATLIGR